MPEMDRYILRTERLILRPVTRSDLPDLHTIFVNPHVRKYLLDDTIMDEQWTQSIIDRSILRFEKEKCGIWIMDYNNAKAGFVGMHTFHDPPELQLLYGLLPEYCGLGLATEAASKVIDYCFELGHAKVLASTDEPNQNSEKVMQRLGMKFVKKESLSTGLTLFYEIYLDPHTGP